MSLQASISGSGSGDDSNKEILRPLLGADSIALLRHEEDDVIRQEGWMGATVGAEFCLLWGLAWPLFFQTLANEISMVVTTALYGHLGQTDLAAANDTMSMVWFALVFVGGAQNVVYTMAPQAKGAGNRQQVGVVLQLTLFWTCVVLTPLTMIAVYYMGDILIAFNLIEEGESSSGSGSGDGWQLNSHGQDEKASITTFAHTSVLWILPYVLVTTVTTWLDAISEVKGPSFISAVWAVIMIALSWLLMYRGWTFDIGSAGMWTMAPGGLGLSGFAYASAICFSLQMITLYLYVFQWKKLHVKPGAEVWFGWQPKRVFHCGLNQRFIMLALPMMLQYALNSWTSSVFQLFMSSKSQLLSAAYGITSTYISTGGSVSNALFMAVSTRVGEVLGEGHVQRAKIAAVIGFIFAAAAGAVISVGIYFLRKPLANFYTESQDVANLAIDASPWVFLYYFINSATWGCWAIMQGQMRTCFPATIICLGMWFISVRKCRLGLHSKSRCCHVTHYTVTQQAFVSCSTGIFCGHI